MTQLELAVMFLAFVTATAFALYRLVKCSTAWMEPKAPVIPGGADSLKTWPQFYQAIFEDRKTFEVRKSDRDFQVGQVWYLREWLPELNPRYTITNKEYVLPARYTGSWVMVRITYVIHHEDEGPASGVAPGFCVWGFKVLQKYDVKLNLHMNDRGLII